MVKLETLGMFLLLAVVIVASIVYGHHHKSVPKEAAQQTAWSTYSSQKYGFQLSYPNSWGVPEVSRTQGQKGADYAVTFSKVKSDDKRRLSINLDMTSEDYQRQVCPDGQCVLISNVTTASTVNSDLKKNQASYLSHDTSSYGFIISSTGSTTLHQAQIVSLPSLKISAANGSITVNNASNCPQNKFASASQTVCINQTDYNMLAQVLRSLKST